MSQQDDDQLRALGGDPEFMRRLERGEHLTDDFLKGVGPEREVDRGKLEEWQALARSAADDLRKSFSAECEGEPRTEAEIAEQAAEQDAWLASQAESVLFAPKAPLRMYAVFSPSALKAMKGVRGKLAAQSGHAFLHAWWDADLRHPEAARAYRASEHAYKIGLNGTMPDEMSAPADADEAWFDRLVELYRPICGVTKVVDAGFTVFDGPTLTCVGIGPISPDDREDILRSLKPLS